MEDIIHHSDAALALGQLMGTRKFWSFHRRRPQWHFYETWTPAKTRHKERRYDLHDFWNSDHVRMLKARKPWVRKIVDFRARTHPGELLSYRFVGKKK